MDESKDASTQKTFRFLGVGVFSFFAQLSFA